MQVGGSFPKSLLSQWVLDVPHHAFCHRILPRSSPSAAVDVPRAKGDPPGSLGGAGSGEEAAGLDDDDKSEDVAAADFQ